MTSDEPGKLEDKCCVPCKERGRMTPGTEKVGEEWMCRYCFAGFDGPSDPKVRRSTMRGTVARLLAGHTVDLPDGTPKEGNGMAHRIEIDETKLRELHAQGLSDLAIGKKLGVSTATARNKRLALGLAAQHRGNNPSGKNSGHVPRPAKLSRSIGTKTAPNGGGKWAEMIADLTAQRDKLQTAIDALADLD